MSYKVADRVADGCSSATLTCRLTLGATRSVATRSVAASATNKTRTTNKTRVADGCRWLQIKRGICNPANTLRNRGLETNYGQWLQSGR